MTDFLTFVSLSISMAKTNNLAGDSSDPALDSSRLKLIDYYYLRFFHRYKFLIVDLMSIVIVLY